LDSSVLSEPFNSFRRWFVYIGLVPYRRKLHSIMPSKTLLSLLLSAVLTLAHPLSLRTLSTSTLIIASTTSLTSAAIPTSTPSAVATTNNTSISDLDILFEGNKKFREQRTELTKELARDLAPGILFIGCSDNRFSTETIFQTPIGSTVSQLNLANQFSAKDASSNAAVTYAIYDLDVKHIIVMGHYGCKSVQTAMSPQQSVDKTVQTWLQPIINIYNRSRRVEIKDLRNSRKGNNVAVIKTGDSALRALVEENVKANVKNLMNESILSMAYHRRNKRVKKVKVYVHGFVFDEETGEVKNLDVSFGPPGKLIPKVPFEAIVEAKKHNQFGKWKAKAKKLAPTPTSTSATSTPT